MFFTYAKTSNKKINEPSSSKTDLDVAASYRLHTQGIWSNMEICTVKLLVPRTGHSQVCFSFLFFFFLNFQHKLYSALKNWKPICVWGIFCMLLKHIFQFHFSWKESNSCAQSLFHNTNQSWVSKDNLETSFKRMPQI